MTSPVWVTPAGSIGVFPALVPMSARVVANSPLSLGLTYKVISGELPSGITFRADGLISGTMPVVKSDISFTFVVRVTDILNNISDRTFSLTVTGDAIPKFITPSGASFNTFDSEWIEIPIEYSNPISDNPVFIRVLQGQLPPGLEINEFGLIRGYPEPPITFENTNEITTVATSTDNSNNFITVLSTIGFVPNRPVRFEGTLYGGLTPFTTYYIKQVINATQFTITNIPNGNTLVINSGSGFMDVVLPSTTVGSPSKQQYSFTLELISPLGNDTATYSITVINHYLPISQGGPNPTNPPNSRLPTIFNTRPPTFNIEADTTNYGYYILPPIDSVDIPGQTYAPTELAYIGRFLSDNQFAFRILGHDFDNSELKYFFSGTGTPANLPSFLTGNAQTGWIYGDPNLMPDDIQEFSFRAEVQKAENTAIVSPTFNFKFKVTKDITGDIVWITDSNLGTFNNSSISYVNLVAESDVELLYRLTPESGSLPPNLSLNENGELIGTIAYQPTNTLEEKNDIATFTFTVEAYNPNFVDNDGNFIVSSIRTFTLNVLQLFDTPTDNLYIKCSPSLENRNIIRSLLDNTTYIPDEYLFRPTDNNFGKAKSIIYAHAYGIFSSDLEQYIEAVQKNHYWRNITLGEIKTAIARNSDNEIIYEVVYSDVIDNLAYYDPKYNFDYRYSTSVQEEIFWPRFIDLNLGPWYTSSTEIYTSYIFAQDATIITNFREYDIQTQSGIPLLLQQGIPTFYTSLTPGYARVLYPNSLENMRKRVEQELGANLNFNLLPLWMTSQQLDGNTLGFTPAWVICYTKPGFSEIVKNNIENNWPYKLNQINFTIDRFTVDKTLTYNYNSQISLPVWTQFPSATPVPDPVDSENFYVLFPRKTILPTESQY
jgi:hypothetical protein